MLQIENQEAERKSEAGPEEKKKEKEEKEKKEKGKEADKDQVMPRPPVAGLVDLGAAGQMCNVFTVPSSSPLPSSPFFFQKKKAAGK